MARFASLHLLCIIILAKATDITLPNLVAEPGKRFTFTHACFITKYVTRWFKNDKLIAECTDSYRFSALDVYEISMTGNVCNLTIKNVTIHDRGVYYCKNGNNRFVMRLNVTDPTLPGTENMNSSVFETGKIVAISVAALFVVSLISAITIRVRKRSSTTVEPARPVQIPTIDRSEIPFYNSYTSVAEFGGLKAGQLRTVIVPSSLTSCFLSAAASNTSRHIGTIGILCGHLSRDTFIITHLFIPQEQGDRVTCETENEQELVAYQEKHNLITLGWIRTHPTQTAFLSSSHLNSHFPWQTMMPEAIAIVCAPKYDEIGVFALTGGLGVIVSCQLNRFHPNIQESSLFRTYGHVKISEGEPLKVENRMKHDI